MNVKKERAEVVSKLHQLRRKLTELAASRGSGSGADVRADIQTCQGQILVLKKELEAIEHRGLTTFLASKELLEPKKGIGAKQKRMRWKRAQLKKRLSKLKEQGGKEAEEAAERIRAELAELAEENAALKDFNHTRFMLARTIDQESKKLSDDAADIDEKIASAESRLAEVREKGDESAVAKAEDELHDLRMEKKSIEDFSHTQFLQNRDKVKARRRSELK